MARIENWNAELRTWLSPFLGKLGHKARRRMCPLYVAGLIGPGDRKSVQPMAERLATGNYDQLHHFIADGVWDAAPLESELLNQADRLVGGKDAVLVIDDTAVPVMIALRLFLPESWTSDAPRLKLAGVPVEYRTPRSKPEIALAEIDRTI